MLKSRLDELIEEVEQHYKDAFDDHEALLPKTLRLMIDLAVETRRTVVPAERFRWIVEKYDSWEPARRNGQILYGGKSRKVQKRVYILQHRKHEGHPWKDVPVVGDWGNGQIALPPEGMNHDEYEKLKRARFEAGPDHFRMEYQQEFTNLEEVRCNYCQKTFSFDGDDEKAIKQIRKHIDDCHKKAKRPKKFKYE